MVGMRIDFTQFAREIDEDLNVVDQAAIDALDPKDRPYHPHVKMMEAVIAEVRKAKAREAVEAARLQKVPFVISTEADILNRPSPSWIVRDLIQEDTIALLAGPGGVGKSFMALAIARAVACGTPFFGKPTTQGKTLYVVAEGAAAFGDRVKAWNTAHSGWIVPGDAIAYVEAGVNLKDSTSVETLAQMVADGNYSLVILDTLSQLGHVENENAAGEIATVFRAIKSIRDGRAGTSVLVLDHTPATGGKVRGSTAKRDNSDTVIMAIPAGDSFTLSTRNADGGKQKDGVEIEWHGFNLQPVLNSAILSNNGGKRELSPYWAACLPALQTGPQTTSQLREACGIEGSMNSSEGKRLGREMEHWVRDGLIERTGPKTRPVFTLTAQAEGVLT